MTKQSIYHFVIRGAPELSNVEVYREWLRLEQAHRTNLRKAAQIAAANKRIGKSRSFGKGVKRAK